MPAVLSRTPSPWSDGPAAETPNLGGQNRDESMRGFSGAVLIQGVLRVGAVTLRDPRPDTLRELLMDFSRPGLCIVLGAGGSHGIVPMTRREIAELARELLQAGGNSSILPARYRRELLDHPEAAFVAELLRSAPREAWDRMLDVVSPGQASFVLNTVFAPKGDFPTELVKIYDVLENERGVIVTYNYDRITDRAKSRFRVVSPHGERSDAFLDPRTQAEVRRMTLELHLPVRNDWWLPVPETVQVQYRPAYQEALNAWRAASAIVFVGYGFGGGDDAFSYEDFGRSAAFGARVHVLCPLPDNRDLCKQVGYALRGRGPRFRVFGQPYRWRSLARAMLDYLRSIRRCHVREAIGAEIEIALRHDNN